MNLLGNPPQNMNKVLGAIVIVLAIIHGVIGACIPDVSIPVTSDNTSVLAETSKRLCVITNKNIYNVYNYFHRGVGIT